MTPGAADRERLELLHAVTHPCHLCERVTNHWADICDRCNVAIMELADRIGEPSDRRGEHFHGCPTPVGRPFDCDWCQERYRGMSE